MWVFGYGSLMWDGWENQHGCIRRILADLFGYCRVFNKASVVNWGTKVTPCPTLNLIKMEEGVCQGIAFEFLDSQQEEVLAYLAKREGKAFKLHQMSVRLQNDNDVLAFVPLYEGQNLIKGKSLEEIASMVAGASGNNGTCLNYIYGIARKLSELKIHDPAVTELRRKTNPQV